MFAAVHLPDLAVAAALRATPEAQSLPCAVLAQERSVAKGKLPLRALNGIARQAGLVVGWPLSRALVRCPELRVLGRAPDYERLLLQEVLEFAESLTPDFERTAADTVIMDLTRSRPSAKLAAEDFWLESVRVIVGFGVSPDLAHVLVCQRAHDGSEEVDHFPLDSILPISRDDTPLPVLKLWGVRTLGELMRLPRQALWERLGPEAGRWHDVLHGREIRKLSLYEAPENWSQSVEFEDPMDSLDQVLFAVKRLLQRLVEKLAQRYLAVKSLTLEFSIDSQKPLRRTLRFPEPMSSLAQLLPPLQAMISALQLHGPILSLKLDAESTITAYAQRQWFEQHLAQPARWAETLAKLEALVGADRVGIPHVRDGHAPDAFELGPAISGPIRLAVRSQLPACSLPLHRFRPPCEVSVAHEMLGAWPRPLALLNGKYVGEIVDLRGPFPSSGAWWQAEGAWSRLEWDIQLTDRELLRLVLVHPDKWLLEGAYL